MTIVDYLAAWDPYGLIDETLNLDEYSVEAAEVKFKYSSSMSADEVGILIHSIMVDKFEHDFPGLIDECKRRGSVIKQVIEQGEKVLDN